MCFGNSPFVSDVSDFFVKSNNNIWKLEGYFLFFCSIHEVMTIGMTHF